MGWQDAPIVKPPTTTWKDAPVVEPSEEPTLGERAAGVFRPIYRGVRQAFEGKYDPKFKDVPEYAGEGVPMDKMSGIARGEVVSQGDDELANVMKTQLGDQFVRMERDENGYPLLTYRSNTDGSEKTVYVNKPGFTWRDPDRFISTALPYVAAASGAGRLTKGAGLATRAIGQAVAGGAASVGEDLVAGQMGSEMTPDLPRAGAAAAGGYVGEGASTLLSKAATWFAKRGLFSGGKLTRRGLDIAKQNGINPDDLTAAAAKQFAGDVATGAHPKAAATKARVESRGIRGTTGEYTDDPYQLMLERDLRKGRMGTHAADEMAHFDAQRTEDLAKSVDDYSAQNFGHGVETPAGAGQELQSGVRTRYQTKKADVDEAFDQYDPTKMRPRHEDKRALADRFSNLKNSDPKLYNDLTAQTEVTAPNTVKALDDLEKWTSKKGLTTDKSDVLGSKPQELDFEQLRRRLTTYRELAAKSDNSTDLRLVSRVVDNYNKSLIDAASNLNNSTDTMKYLRALDMHRDLMKAFGTRGDPALDPGGKFIQDLIHKDATPEGIIDKVLGAGKKAPMQSVAILKRLRETLGDDSPEWAILKATAMYKMTTSGGKSLAPGKMVGQSADLLQNNSIYKELFDADELKSLNRYFEDVKVLEGRGVPPGVRSKQLNELERVRQEGFLKFFFRKMGTRETFRGRPFNSLFWNMLAKSKLSTPILPFERMGATHLARKATSGALPKKPPARGGAGVGAAAGARMEDF